MPPRRALALAFSALALIAAAPKRAQPKPAAPKPGAATAAFTAPDYVMGSPRAKVTVVEYASVTCPHCARFDAEVFPELKKRWIDTGKVRYVFREFLTPPEEVAAAGFMIARCAGESRYFSTVENLFRAQREMFALDDGSNVLPTLYKVGAASGLDQKQVDACINDPANLKAINARMQKALDADKVTSTPTVLVNDKRLDPKDREIAPADMDAAIRAALAGK